jgi:hypothetical protein
MGEFKFKFFTRRFHSDVTLNVRKTNTGWHISHIAINGDTGPSGEPILSQNLHQDNVHFPYGLDGFFGFIWSQLQDGAVDDERAQAMFDELGEWVSTCEGTQPVWRIWNA